MEQTAQIKAADLVFAKEAADALNNHYPGHLWAVDVSGGMLNILNLVLSDRYGYRLKIPDVYSMSDFKRKAVAAGGEILERFKVRRGGVNFDNLSSMPHDFAGRMIGDTAK